MTELIWDGKYKDGKKVTPVRIALPFQTIETVNESAQDRLRTLDLFATGREPEWRNRLIWGDKKYVLPSLLPEFAGRVNLIYIDPPFDTSQDFSYTATIPDNPTTEDDEGASFVKEPSLIEQKAYRDTWGRGLNSYLQWFYETVLLLRELLAEDGSIYVHIEPDIGNYVRPILDELFGDSGLRTEIAWKRTSSHGNVSRSFGEIWESIFFYTKLSEARTWNQQYVPFDPEYVEKHFTGQDPDSRRWTTSDMRNPGYRIHTTRKRLLGISGVRPFVVQNLGKYERQAWQAAEFAAPDDLRERELRYRRFILDLYHATPVSGHTWLHGVKAQRMVHVGTVDAPVTLADVKAIAAEVWRAVGKGKDAPKTAGVDILGWEFAFELNELARQVAAEARADVSFKKIPREVLEKRAVEQGDIRFFELAALAVDLKAKKREVLLKLTDFIVSPDDVPEEVRGAIKHWSQYVDYWAVDWDYKGDTFHNQWQTYRTRKNPKLETATTHIYGEPGKHTVLVKVIDILGNDTTKALEIELK